ncbi:MAG: cupin domain-containing protein [Saprospiraceae bacterium]
MTIEVMNSLDKKSLTAGDLTEIRELLHPLKGDPELPYSLAFGSLPAGESSLPHRLRSNKEVYYILSGTARLRVDDVTCEIQQGDFFCVPENALQSLENTGQTELQFLCIVSPPWTAAGEDVSGK